MTVAFADFTFFEIKENLKQFQEEAKKYEESEALQMAKQRISFMGKLKVIYLDKILLHSLLRKVLFVFMFRFMVFS